MANTETTKSGMNADKWLKHRSIYRDGQITLQEATSENQAHLKAAKADGIHIDAMKMVSKLNRKDPADAAAFLRAMLEGALIERCAFMFQGDMLNGGSIADLFKTAEPSPRAVAQFKEGEALEIGYAEGVQGGSIDNLTKQFEPGTAALNAAIRGFKRGRQFMESSAPAGVVPVAPSKGRRGGRRKASDEASAAPAEAEDGDAEDDNREFDEPSRGSDDPDQGSEGEAAAPVEIDMAAVAALSNHKMAKFWNELTGQNIKKFENRDVALEKFAKLAAGQRSSAESRAN